MNQNISNQPPVRKPVFGKLSLVAFCLCVCLTVLYLCHRQEACDDIIGTAIASASSSASSDGGFFSSHWLGLYFHWPALYFVAGIVGVHFGLLGSVLAVVGLVRAERPRWVGITGLLLCVCPAVYALLFWGSAFSALFGQH